jgi:hypothetical protein
MITYQIKITYTQVDGVKKKSKYLDLEWNNLTTALKNLYHIKEHNGMCREFYSFMYPEKEIVSKYLNKIWFVNVSKLYLVRTENQVDEGDKHLYNELDLEYKMDFQSAKNTINLETDSGDIVPQSIFWDTLSLKKIKVKIKTNILQINI